MPTPTPRCVRCDTWHSGDVEACETCGRPLVWPRDEDEIRRWVDETQGRCLVCETPRPAWWHPKRLWWWTCPSCEGMVCGVHRGDPCRNCAAGFGSFGGGGNDWI